MDNNVNFNVAAPQFCFNARKVNNKKAYEIIDNMNDRAVELLNKDQPIEEKKEIAIRKSLEWIFKKLGFGKKLRNAGKEEKEEIAANKAVNVFNDVYRNIKLKHLMKTNPDEAREQIMRESLEDIGRFIKDV